MHDRTFKWQVVKIHKALARMEQSKYLEPHMSQSLDLLANKLQIEMVDDVGSQMNYGSNILVNLSEKKNSGPVNTQYIDKWLPWKKPTKRVLDYK